MKSPDRNMGFGARRRRAGNIYHGHKHELEPKDPGLSAFSMKLVPGLRKLVAPYANRNKPMAPTASDLPPI